MVLGFLTVEEERNVQTFLRQSDSGGNGDGDALISGAIEDGTLIADLFKIGLGIKFAQFSDLLAGLDLACVDKIGDLATALGGEIAKLQNAGALQKFNKFSFITFHCFSP